MLALAVYKPQITQYESLGIFLKICKVYGKCPQPAIGTKCEEKQYLVNHLISLQGHSICMQINR